MQKQTMLLQMLKNKIKLLEAINKWWIRDFQLLLLILLSQIMEIKVHREQEMFHLTELRKQW